MKAIGFTCGIGSLLVGARAKGFDIVGNIEWRKYYHHKDKEGRNTFTHNFPDSFMVKSVDEMTEEQIEAATGCDLAMGHPECGNFSQMSYSVKRADGSTQDDVFKMAGDIPLFVEMVQRFKPRFFIMDDLPKAFLAYPMEKYAEMLPDYDLFPEWVSNYHYGNIQKFRKRFFMVGALKSEEYTFVPGEEEHSRTMKDVIGDLLGDDSFDKVSNHHPHILTSSTSKGKGMTPETQERHMNFAELRDWFASQPQGKTIEYVKSDGTIGKHIGVRTGYWEGFCPVLHGGHPIYHPVRNLPLTVRERARIQGFPDDFEFIGEVLNEDGTWDHYRNMHLIKQTGKAMPIQFAEYISEQVRNWTKGDGILATQERLIKRDKHLDEAKSWYCENVGYSDQDSVCEFCQIKECEKGEKNEDL